MKKVLALVLVLVTMLSGCVTRSDSDPDSGGIMSDWERAHALAMMIVDGEFEAFMELLSPEMRELVSVQMLVDGWAQVTSQIGEFTGFLPDGTDVAQDSGYLVYQVLSTHEDPAWCGVFAFVMDGDVIVNFSLLFAPNPFFSVDDLGETEFHEEPVVVGENGDYPLDGFLSMPKDADAPVPAVVMILGSGPTDMDSTVGLHTPARDIAHGLASRGIAVIRYNKRTHTYAEKLVEEYGSKMTVEQEYVEDALLAREMLANDPRIDANRIFLLGHSQGGTLAPEIAELGGFAGTIILAGATRPLPLVMYEQMRYLTEGLPEDEAEETLAPYLANYEIFLSALEMTDEEAQNVQMIGGSAYYYTDLQRRHPSNFIRGYTRPMLILQGSMDYQVRLDTDFQEYLKLTEGMENVTTRVYEGLTHTFTQSVSNTGMGTPNDYAVNNSVDDSVITDIAEFVHLQK